MGKVINIRVSDQKWQEYAERAQEKNLGLSTYLKKCLDRNDDMADHFQEMRRGVEETLLSAQSPAANAPINSALSPSDRGLLIEAVLLLRSIVGQEKISMVQGELERQGLPRWSIKNGGNKG